MKTIQSSNIETGTEIFCIIRTWDKYYPIPATMISYGSKKCFVEYAQDLVWKHFNKADYDGPLHRFIHTDLVALTEEDAIKRADAINKKRKDPYTES